MRASRLTIAPVLAVQLTIVAACAKQPRVAEARRPTLAVLLVLDGLRGDLPERYDSVFTGGFRRLHDQGFRYTHAMVDHGVTVSHAGHVTIATGRYPSNHGIVDAAFYVQAPDRRRHLVDALLDSTEHLVGDSTAPPGVSPRHVIGNGLAEWVLNANPESRVAAVSTGQYASLLHVFHRAAPVFWYNPAAGRYVTSSYYLQQLPDWVERFNGAPLAAIADSATVWTPLLDLHYFDLGRPDSNAFEADGRHSAFPHRLADMLPAGTTITPAKERRWLARTPFADDATLHLAQETVRALSLGQRGATDYLAIVLSQTDDLGHDYGPNSHEELDELLRLDRWLGEFFKTLDKTIGKDNWVIAVTADHGMPEIPEYEISHGRPGLRVTEKMIDSLQTDVARVIASGRPADIASVLHSRSWIAAAYSPSDLAGLGGTDSLLTLVRHSWRPDRTPRLPLFRFSDGTSSVAEAGWMVRLTEGTGVDLDRAVHGSPYAYDRHVPLFFYGAGVEHGVSDGAARTIDVAPTLAKLMGVTTPTSVDGRALVLR